MNITDMSNIFKIISNENRLKILSILSSNEVCACVLLENLSINQSTLSHHMKMLVDGGLVSARKHQQWMYYKVNNEFCFDLISQFKDLLQENEELSLTCKHNKENTNGTI